MALSETRIADLLVPYLGNTPVQPTLYTQIAVYLDLLVRWNVRTNLTAIRDPEEIVQRHFGEGLFAGKHLAVRLDAHAALLDFGSGAGFPGLPIQLLLPGLRVTLAESQGKKASFLHEVVRTLGLNTEVWAERVEALPAGRRFDAVTLRAVDKMPEALAVARPLVAEGGWLVTLASDYPELAERFAVPGATNSWLTFECGV